MCIPSQGRQIHLFAPPPVNLVDQPFTLIHHSPRNFYFLVWIQVEIDILLNVVCIVVRGVYFVFFVFLFFLFFLDFIVLVEKRLEIAEYTFVFFLFFVFRTISFCVHVVFLVEQIYLGSVLISIVTLINLWVFVVLLLLVFILNLSDVSVLRDMGGVWYWLGFNRMDLLLFFILHMLDVLVLAQTVLVLRMILLFLLVQLGQGIRLIVCMGMGMRHAVASANCVHFAFFNLLFEHIAAIIECIAFLLPTLVLFRLLGYQSHPFLGIRWHINCIFLFFVGFILRLRNTEILVAVWMVVVCSRINNFVV